MGQFVTTERLKPLFILDGEKRKKQTAVATTKGGTETRVLGSKASKSKVGGGKKD